MKSLAVLALTLTLIAATATAVRAHVDSLGQPDPSWHPIAAASAAKGSEVPRDGTAPLDDFVSSGGLSVLLLALGLALALDVAMVPGGRTVARAEAWASKTPATDDPPGGPAELVHDDAIRTVDVLPPSTSGETRYVLRLAAAIVLGVLFFSVLQSWGVPGNDRVPQAGQRSTHG